MSRTDDAAAFYSRWAPVYDALARHTPGIGRMRHRLARELDPPRGGTVVEMGCGTGGNLPYLADIVGPDGTVIGIDIAPGALHTARRRIDVRGDEHVSVIRGDATRPPIGSTDAVVATFVVGMFTNPEATVHSWCDLVGPGGRVGLLHLARSERRYGPLVNLGLRALVLLSTPGKGRLLTDDATALLDRRVTAGHAVLAERCADAQFVTTGGGLVHVATGTVE